jgi:hypothetical protein
MLNVLDVERLHGLQVRENGRGSDYIIGVMEAKRSSSDRLWRISAQYSVFDLVLQEH